MRRFRKIVNYVIGGGVALFVKQLWEPVLRPFSAPIAAVLGAQATRLAMLVGIAVA